VICLREWRGWEGVYREQRDGRRYVERKECSDASICKPYFTAMKYLFDHVLFPSRHIVKMEISILSRRCSHISISPFPSKNIIGYRLKQRKITHIHPSLISHHFPSKALPPRRIQFLNRPINPLKPLILQRIVLRSILAPRTHGFVGRRRW